MIDFTLSAFVGSPHHSMSLKTTLPSNTVTKKSVILSNILLTGDKTFSATFFNPSNLFSSLLSASALFSFSAFFLSKSALSLSSFFFPDKIPPIESIDFTIAEKDFSKSVPLYFCNTEDCDFTIGPYLGPSDPTDEPPRTGFDL